MKVIQKPQGINFTLEDFPTRGSATAVLMAAPTFYDVVYVINPHMKGNIGNVDKDLAWQQWHALKSCYERLGYPVNVIEGPPHLPDMVFAANQSFPYLDSAGNKIVIISRMASQHRVPEVEFFAKWYENQSYRIVRQVEPPVHFEGMGDAIWHPDRRLLYIGYGYRTDVNALQRAANFIECPVVGLELTDPHFYHLDTALSPIDESTAVYVAEAFTNDGLKILNKLFKRLIRVPLEEAKSGFVTNGHSPDQKHYIMQKDNPITVQKITQHGYKVIEVDTSEFMKSGGSVFCMKMMLP